MITILFSLLRHYADDCATILRQPRSHYAITYIDFAYCRHSLSPRHYARCRDALLRHMQQRFSCHATIDELMPVAESLMLLRAITLSGFIALRHFFVFV